MLTVNNLKRNYENNSIYNSIKEKEILKNTSNQEGERLVH